MLDVTFYKVKEITRLELFIIMVTIRGVFRILRDAKWKRSMFADLLSSTYEGPGGETRKGNFYTFIRSMYESDRMNILNEN